MMYIAPLKDLGPRSIQSSRERACLISLRTNRSNGWRLKIQRSLVDLAKMSGGWAEFLETKAQTASIYNRILADLNLRYIIGYYPSNKNHDGKKRQITIEVKGHPEYLISSRNSY